MKIKRLLGLDAGSSYNFGVKNAIELESYGNFKNSMDNNSNNK